MIEFELAAEPRNVKELLSDVHHGEVQASGDTKTKVKRQGGGQDDGRTDGSTKSK